MKKAMNKEIDEERYVKKLQKTCLNEYDNMATWSLVVIH
jgi:hypothetical protein